MEKRIFLILAFLSIVKIESKNIKPIEPQDGVCPKDYPIMGGVYGSEKCYKNLKECHKTEGNDPEICIDHCTQICNKNLNDCSDKCGNDYDCHHDCNQTLDDCFNQCPTQKSN